MRVGGWMVLGAALAIGKPAAAQFTAYVDYSVTKLKNPIGTTYANGPTFGVSAEVLHGLHATLSADVRAFHLSGGNLELGTGNLTMTGVGIGPKVSTRVKRFTPYGEFLVGFARYNDGNGLSTSGTTDSQLEINFGSDFRVTTRIDWRVFEYGYKQYYANGGEFNPKTFSTGFVYHIGKS